MKKLFILATAAVALASCSDSDLVGNIASSQQTEQPQAVEFVTYMGSAATRTGTAGTITTASLKTGTHKDDGFGVMGYQMTADWANDQSTTTPNFMYNQQIKWNTGGFWTYSPVKYWPNGVDAANAENDPSKTAVSTNGDKLNFFAYAPWVDVAAGNGYTTPTSITLPASGTARNAFYTKDATASDLGNGIAAIKANNVKAAPEVYYYMPIATTADAVDLLWGLRGSKTYNETDGTDNTVTALGDSYNVNLTKQVVPETVNFLFKHALSKIGGNTTSTTSTAGTQKCGLKVVLDIDGNGNGINGVDNQSLYLGNNFDNTKTLVTIKSVAVQDGASAYAERASQTDPDKNALPDSPTLYSDLINSGWFNLATGTWNNVQKIDKAGATATSGATYSIEATTSGTYKLDPQIAEPTAAQLAAILDANKDKWNGTGLAGSPNGVVASAAKNVYSDDTDVPSLLMIPNGTTAQTLYVTVDYIVRTADPQLSTGYSQVEQIVTNKVSLTGLEVNKYYTLVMHLGLTSVKFSAIVADWANSDDASYDEGGTTDGTAEAAEEVWLPSNVIAVSTTNASTPKLGTSYNENLKASTTSYTVNLTGLVKGQKITATFAAPITGVSIDGNALTSGTALPLTADNPAGVVTVTLTANTKVTAVKSLLSILQEASDDTDLTTTSVNFVQSGYDINLTGTTGTVNVTDDEGNAVTSGLTVVVKDATTGVELTSGYSVSGGTITISTPGTYNVIVTYTDSASKTVTKTIQTTKASS